MVEAKQLVSRFEGRCLSCGKKISQGESILWKKGEGSMHLNADACHATPDPVLPKYKRKARSDTGQPARPIRPSLGSHAITAKYAGRCLVCCEAVAPGDRVMWRRGQKGVEHETCYQTKVERERIRCDEQDQEAVMAQRETAHENAEYAAGLADAQAFREDRAMFGDDVAERLQIEREMAEDY